MRQTIGRLLVALFLAGAIGGCEQQSDRQAGERGLRSPIIDVHLHTIPPEDLLAHRATAPVECALPALIPALDVAADSIGDLAGSYFRQRLHGCGRLLEPATDEADLIRRTLELLERYNITAVASGPLPTVKRWQTAAPNRIIPGLAGHPAEIDLVELRRLLAGQEVQVVGEIAAQYAGLLPSDPSLDPIFALAEELDVPVGIHIGLSAPGIPVVTLHGFRASASRPLELEPVLTRYPRLRVYVMHAGWPMLDEMLHLLWSFPQVYVDIAVLDWILPQSEFHEYLRRLVDAGFGSRIMFGSDQMVWPEAIEVAIANVEAAPFLTEEQKRDIFYNNAARFLRLSEEEIARHHGR